MTYDIPPKTLNALVQILDWFRQGTVLEHEEDLASSVGELQTWFDEQPFDFAAHMLSLKESDAQFYEHLQRRLQFERDWLEQHGMKELREAINHDERVYKSPGRGRSRGRRR
jgi:hypothetical protein